MAVPTKRPSAYADTSYLFSLVLPDSNSFAAIAYLRAHAMELIFTSWQRCELQNALRLAVWRGNYDLAAMRRACDRISKDVEIGNLQDGSLIWPEVLDLVEELGEKHTMALGVRTLDLLHVAAAVSLGAERFLTFDERQVPLARAAGLHVAKL
jgi:predicted nucleic acid-binding protein